MPTPLVVVGSASLLALAILGWMQYTHNGIPGVTGPNINTEAFWLQAGPKGVAQTGAAPVVFKTGMENMPHSLQGTDVPEGLAEDKSGNLIITQGIRDIFEYFLSASVDEPLETIRARLIAYIKAHVGAKAAQQAITILDQYGAYKMALPEVAKSYPGERPDQVKARFAAIKNMRRSVMGGEVAQAFFGEEESYVQYTLDKGEVQMDANLTPAQKSARIAELKKQLSPNMQDSLATSEMLQNLDEAQAEWKKRGGTPEELRAAREAIVGKDGAMRLEALDRENAAWEARMNAHLAQRDQILTDPSIAPEMKPKRIEALRLQNFSAEEQLRAQALEGLHDETTAAAAKTAAGTTTPAH